MCGLAPSLSHNLWVRTTTWFLPSWPSSGRKSAAQGEALSHHLEPAGGCQSSLDELGLVFGGDVELAAAPGIQVLKSGALPLPVGEVARRDRVVVGLDLRPDHDQLVRLRIGHGSEQRGVVDGEDSRIGADAEREGQQDGEW